MVIHGAFTPEGYDCGMREYEKWHTDPKEDGGNGWLRVGYVYSIRRNGDLEIVDPTPIRYHCRGQNDIAFGVCLAGGKGSDGEWEDNYSKEQMQTLDVLVNEVYPDRPVYFHHELDSERLCPGISGTAEDAFRVHEPGESIPTNFEGEVLSALLSIEDLLRKIEGNQRK